MHYRYLLAFLFFALTSTVEAQRTAIDSVNLADTTVIHVVKLRDGSTLALPSTKGDLLVLVSTVNWAVYTILGRRILPRLGGARPATAGAFVAGAVILAPIFFLTSGLSTFAHLSATGWLSLLFLGIGVLFATQTSTMRI